MKYCVKTAVMDISKEKNTHVEMWLYLAKVPQISVYFHFSLCSGFLYCKA